MITKSLLKTLEEIGFTYSEASSPAKSHAYAIYGGYMVSIYEAAGKRTAYFNFKFSDSEDNALKKYDISEVFSNEMTEYSVIDYSIEDDGMRVVSNGSITQFLKLIDRCIELLIENEIRGVEYCSKCGNKFGSRKPKKLTDGKENHIMCEHCALDTIEEINNRVSEEQAESQKGSVKLGVLGSVLFALLGSCLYFILYYFFSPSNEEGSVDFSYIYCAAGVAVSFLSYLGYRIFCKKASLAAYLSVSLSSLVFTAIGQYIGVVFGFIASNNFPISISSNKHFWLVHLRNTIPADIADQFAGQAYSDTFYKLLAISLMFAAVGAAIVLLTLHDKSIIKKETATVETLSIEQ